VSFAFPELSAHKETFDELERTPLSDLHHSARLLLDTLAAFGSMVMNAFPTGLVWLGVQLIARIAVVDVTTIGVVY
jgi:hypothetical protein